MVELKRREEVEKSLGQLFTDQVSSFESTFYLLNRIYSSGFFLNDEHEDFNFRIRTERKIEIFSLAQKDLQIFIGLKSGLIEVKW